MTLAYRMHFDYAAWADETERADRREAAWRRDLAARQLALSEATRNAAAAAFWRNIERRAAARLEQLDTVHIVDEGEVRA